MPLVSVIVPAYNAAAYIRETLQSVADQSFPDFEVLVVDDGSKDETKQIAEAFAGSDSRFRVIRQVNGGVGAARNTGIRLARGRYIAPLDADDLWYPSKLAEQVARMEAVGELTGLVYCWTNLHRADGTVKRSGGTPRFEGRVALPLLLGNFINCASVPLFRASAVKAVGGYLTRLEQGGAQGCEDWDLSLRVAEKFETYCVHQYLVGYRQVDGMTLNPSPMSDSFLVVQQRAVGRNGHIPARFFRWSAGPFYVWLGGRCYEDQNIRWCLRGIAKAVASDPSQILNSSVGRLVLKSIMRIIFRRPLPPVRSKEAAKRRVPSFESFDKIFDRIQAARLKRLLRYERV